MRKEIKKEIKIYSVDHCELYCDKCNKKINHHQIYWRINMDSHYYDVCSLECANTYWKKYINSPTQGDFISEMFLWDSYEDSSHNINNLI